MNNTHVDTHWNPNGNVTTNTDGETSRTFVPSGTTTTINTGQFQSAPIGWICPKCGRGLAPHTSYCPCYMEEPSTTYRAPNFGPNYYPLGPTISCLNAVDAVSSDKQ